MTIQQSFLIAIAIALGICFIGALIAYPIAVAVNKIVSGFQEKRTVRKAVEAEAERQNLLFEEQVEASFDRQERISKYIQEGQRLRKKHGAQMLTWTAGTLLIVVYEETDAAREEEVGAVHLGLVWDERNAILNEMGVSRADVVFPSDIFLTLEQMLTKFRARAWKVQQEQMKVAA